MDQLLAQFIGALRNADIRVSTAETLDALSAVELVGYSDRRLLKDSLSLVLPKTPDEKAAFDTCFDQFFSFGDRTSLPPIAASNEAAFSGDAAGQAGNGQAGAGGDGQDQRTGTARPGTQQPQQRPANTTAQRDDAATALGSGEMSDPQSPLGQLLVRGNQLEITIAIGTAGRQVNVHEIEVFTQKGVYTRRIMDTMGHAELQQEITRLGESAAIPERRRAVDLTHRRDWLRERVRDYVEHQFLLHADVTGRRLREDLLRTVRLTALEQRHHRMLHDLVLRMARRLVSEHSRRRKVFRRGQLHVPRTLRRNMKYDDAVFDLQWKSVKVDRPKVFAICDVSGSVAAYARFMLMFLYSLEEVLPKVRSFAFSSDLGEVSELFARHTIDDGIAIALKQYGSGATDYGQALADFRRLCLDEIDSRATLIILGDARSNYGDARTDLLKELYDRAKRVIWLNPEPRTMWNTGDSEMRHYSPYCHQVDECSTLAHLERIVGRLLRAAV
ncbi:MAG TPA: VWA domain-containing protein [Steroidobacteraceae bacterium]|nr:VWA domain-containing protein [Steroidobacteraceae bacterium]